MEITFLGETHQVPYTEDEGYIMAAGPDYIATFEPGVEEPVVIRFRPVKEN
jgi:hypothetical protein